MIKGNLAACCELCGIWSMRSHHNRISGNVAAQNNFSGIRLDSSDDNVVSCNAAFNNRVAGIEALKSQNNSFYGNNLTGNLLYSAHDEGENRWGDPDRPNRYSDFDQPAEGCFAKSRPGICGQRYPIQGGENSDRYPRSDSDSFTYKIA